MLKFFNYIYQKIYMLQWGDFHLKCSRYRHINAMSYMINFPFLTRLLTNLIFTLQLIYLIRYDFGLIVDPTKYIEICHFFRVSLSCEHMKHDNMFDSLFFFAIYMVLNQWNLLARSSRYRTNKNIILGLIKLLIVLICLCNLIWLRPYFDLLPKLEIVFNNSEWINKSLIGWFK